MAQLGGASLESELEILRQDMVNAFRDYAKKRPDERDDEWEFYCNCREKFLALAADQNGVEYRPLRMTVVPWGH